MIRHVHNAHTEGVIEEDAGEEFFSFPSETGIAPSDYPECDSADSAGTHVLHG